jgi:hypothetical protein
VLRIGGDPEADALWQETEEELQTLGIPISPAHEAASADRLARRATQIPEPSQGLSPSALIVPVQRLTVRGLGQPQVLSERVRQVATLFDTPVSLIELISTGERLLHGPPPAQDSELVEISDGCGHRFQLSLAQQSPERRAALDLLCRSAAMALEVEALRRLAEASSAGEQPEADLTGVVARSAAMRALFQDVARLGASLANVLILGESGTGKEVVAAAVHRHSARASGPL